jgi:hypothetical protein
MSFVHHDGGEAALEQMPDPTPTRIDEMRVAAVGGADRPRQTCLIMRCKDQVYVVRHETPGPDLDPILARMFREQVAIDVLVTVFEEDALTPVATLGDVVQVNSVTGPAFTFCIITTFAGFRDSGLVYGRGRAGRCGA